MSKIWAWIKALFTAHNVQAIGKVATDVGAVVAEASAGQVPAAVATALQIPGDASNIVVHPTEATPSKVLIAVPTEKKS